MGDSPAPIPSPVSLLTLGSGWVGTYISSECTASGLTHAHTSRQGSATTIPFTFDPSSSDEAPYTLLPFACTVVIIFPVEGKGAHGHLIELYERTHPGCEARWVQLGSTSAFDVPGEMGKPSPPLWRDRHSPVDTGKTRVAAEEELLALRDVTACVLNLAGLWGGERDIRRYVRRVAPTREALKVKGSLHMIHGRDVARGVVALHGEFVAGRWLLTDMRVYDWWELASAWGSEGTLEEASWVMDLMKERGLRALPRSPEQMGGKALDSREFWATFKQLQGPAVARLEKECPETETVAMI